MFTSPAVGRKCLEKNRFEGAPHHYPALGAHMSRGGPATNMPLCTVSSCVLLTDVHLPV